MRLLDRMLRYSVDMCMRWAGKEECEHPLCQPALRPVFSLKASCQKPETNGPIDVRLDRKLSGFLAVGLGFILDRYGLGPLAFRYLHTAL